MCHISRANQILMRLAHTLDDFFLNVLDSCEYDEAIDNTKINNHTLFVLTLTQEKSLRFI